MWAESTDPIKFIHEDIGIASYIASFIYNESREYRKANNLENVRVLDLGCGNGLLCFFLLQIMPHYSRRSEVVGLDIRERKIWKDLLRIQPEVDQRMREVKKHQNPNGGIMKIKTTETVIQLLVSGTINKFGLFKIVILQ